MAGLSQAIAQTLFKMNPQLRAPSPKLGSAIAATVIPSYGMRLDNTPKATGFFGPLQTPYGTTATEVSVGVNFDGQEQLIPSLVPTLTQEEINTVLSLKPEQKMPKNILDKAVSHARQRIGQGLSPFASNEESGFNKFPVRQPFPSELEYFTKNPQVSGMATEDNAITLNPSVTNPSQRQSVIQNEGIRLLINSLPQKPSFEVTPEQRAFFKGSPYENDEQKMRETIAARIFSGDPSAKTPTKEQLNYVEFLKGQISQ